MFPGKQQTRLPRPVDRKLGLCASPPKATESGNPESAPHSSVRGALVSPTSICSLPMPRVGDQLRGSLPGGPRGSVRAEAQVKPASLVSSSAGHRQWMSQGFLAECSELLFVPASWRGCHFLLQGIFPTQGPNPCLLHWQADSLPLCHLGSALFILLFLISCWPKSVT